MEQTKTCDFPWLLKTLSHTRLDLNFNGGPEMDIKIRVGIHVHPALLERFPIQTC